MTEPATRRPVLLLINPAAGRKPAGIAPGDASAPGEAAERLRSRGLEVEVHELAPNDDAERLARTAAEEGRDVVVAGGDGTVGPAASGLVGTEASLGIIPVGTFNNTARGAGIPLDLEQALDVVARGRTARLDVGMAWHVPPGEAAALGASSWSSLAPPADAAFFLEAAGVGLDAAGFGVAQVGHRLGWLPAARAAWRAFQQRKTPIWLIVDGKRYRTASPAVTICNGPFFGFGFALVPEASPTDGLLDVVIFVRMGRVEVLRHFLRVARGRPRREPRVRTLRARTIVVGGLQPVLPAHADGQVFGITPIVATVRPGALRLFI
jgi:diacylglycerol kinase (ATP)